MIKLVVIDFDDTLCLTQEACFELENLIAQKMSFEPMTMEDHKSSWGMDFRDALAIRFPGINVEDFLRIYDKYMRQFIKDGKLDAISDINLNTLKTLRNSGMKVAILTSRELFEVEHLLHKDHILNNYIDTFYHKDNNPFAKPDPRTFDSVLAQFDIPPQESVYIGDNIIDGMSSKGAGMHFIALMESKLRTKEIFKSVQVDYFAATFPDILKYILPEVAVV